MKIIGLCGGSGSGKGTVAQMFAKYGVAHIDTDDVYHGLTAHPSACVDEVAARFGAGVVSPCGGLNRRALAEIVFADGAGELLSELGQITHKHILAKTRELIARYTEEGRIAVIIDAPVLYESGFDAICDVTVAVTAPVQVRVSRIMLRDGISEEAALKRIGSQLSDEELALRADYIINNCGGLDLAEARVREVADDILK